MEGMDSNPQMEGVLPACLCHVLVRTDSSSFQSFARQLLVLIRHEVAAEGKLVNVCTLTSQIEYPDLQDISWQYD